MPKWHVELRRTQTSIMEIDAPDPATRDAIAFGVQQFLDEGLTAKLPNTVTLVSSSFDGWNLVKCDQIREGE